MNCLPITVYQNKKEPYPSRHREVELSQRTGQLLIVCLMGRGTPVTVNLYPHAPNCQERSADWHQQAGSPSTPSINSGQEAQDKRVV